MISSVSTPSDQMTEHNNDFAKIKTLHRISIQRRVNGSVFYWNRPSIKKVRGKNIFDKTSLKSAAPPQGFSTLWISKVSFAVVSDIMHRFLQNTRHFSPLNTKTIVNIIKLPAGGNFVEVCVHIGFPNRSRSRCKCEHLDAVTTPDPPRAAPRRC